MMLVARRLGWVVVLGAAIAFVWASRDALTEVSISMSGVFVAGVVVALGVLGGALSWAVLFQRSDWIGAVRAFLIAQPAKYLPVGGVAQAVGQVRLSPEAGSARLLLSHMALQLVSAAILSAGWLATRGSVPGGWWIMAPVQLLSITVIAPIAFRTVATRLPRVFDPSIPIPRAAACLISTWVPLIGGGIALDVLLGGTPGGTLGSISVWALAWWIGFVAVPFPAGAGVREFVLVGAFGTLDAATVVASAVVLRVLMAASEIALFLIASAVVRTSGHSTNNPAVGSPAIGTTEQ